MIANKVQNINLINKSCLRLDNKHLYFVEINWDLEDDCNEDFKYFNLFIKQNDGVPFKFIGSTTTQCFSLCLELIDFYFNYSQNSDYNTTENKISKILIQYVSEDYELNEFKQEFHSFVDIEIPGGASISRVVTDFEYVF